MSYILEALKKIEQKRTQEESLKPISFYQEGGEGTRKRPLWPVLLIAALVLNAGLFLWWLGFQGTTKKEMLSQAPLGSARVPQTTPPARDPRDQLKVIKKDMPAPRLSNPSPDLPVKKKEQPPVTKAEEKAPAPKPAKVETAAVAKEAISSEKGVNVKRSNRVVGFEELPDGLKKTLPALKISTHVYGADPEGRLVRINDRTLQEGQELSTGLKVEEIIPGGAILSYQGYRFRIGLKE